MTFTYTISGTTSVEKVRRMTGDVDSTRPLLQDEEMNPIIAANPALTQAAAACIDIIIMKIIRDALDIRIGQTSVNAEPLIKHYLMMKKVLLESGGGDVPLGSTNLEPNAGGISKAENQVLQDDSDFVRSPIQVGMHDFPGTPDEKDLANDSEDGWEW